MHLMYTFPRVLRSVDDPLLLMQFINNTMFCIGNPDVDFVERWQYRSSSLYSGMHTYCRSLIDSLGAGRKAGFIVGSSIKCIGGR